MVRTYLRKRQKGNKMRKVAGYTRDDGTRVASYYRKKAKGTKQRSVRFPRRRR